MSAILKLKGGPFRLNDAPHIIDDEGCRVYHLNAPPVDVLDTACELYRQVHGNTPTPESDRRYEQVLRDRAERELTEKKAQARA